MLSLEQLVKSTIQLCNSGFVNLQTSGLRFALQSQFSDGSKKSNLFSVRFFFTCFNNKGDDFQALHMWSWEQGFIPFLMTENSSFNVVYLLIFFYIISFLLYNKPLSMQIVFPHMLPCLDLGGIRTCYYVRCEIRIRIFFTYVDIKLTKHYLLKRLHLSQFQTCF